MALKDMVKKTIRFFCSGALLLCLMLGLPAHARDYKALGAALLETAQEKIAAEDLPIARQILEQSLLADPAQAETFLWLGRVSALQGDALEAIRLMQIALEIEPSLQQAYFWQGELYIEQEKFEDAQKNLDKLTALCSDCAVQKDLAARLQNVSKDKNAPAGDDAKEAPPEIVN